MAVVFKNNAKTTLASGLTSSATSVTVADGSAFPSLSGGDTFFCTFDNGTNVEVVKVTARSSNTLTIVRAQDDTTARAFSTGDVAELRLTAGILNLFSQTGVAITDEIEAYLDANGLTFPDNVKAQFGAGNDLQIYHDGSHSYVRDVGTGNLKLQGTNLNLQNEGGTKNYLVAVNSGAVQLYHNNNSKIQTTSTGINVTGGITATTSLSLNGSTIALDTGNDYMEFNKALFSPIGYFVGTTGTKVGHLQNSAGVFYMEAATTRQIAFGNETNGEFVRIDATGNTTFTGTISSGAITSTGEIEATALDINGNGDISGNLTLGGYLAGPATFTIDPAAVGDNTGTVVIAGNLQVDGTTTTINSTTLTVDDKNITLASGSTNAAAANGAGLTVDCGSNTDATFTYDGTNDEWDFNKDINVTGTISSGEIVSTSNITANGYLQAYSFLYTRNNLRVLNAAGTGWKDWAVRSNGNYNLDVGTISGTGISTGANLIDLFSNQNGVNELRLDNNRQDLGNVAVSKVSGRNSVEVGNMTFYRGGGGASGFIRFQNKPTNAASLTDVFQVGDGATVGYGVNIMAGGLRIGGTEIITSSRNLTNIGTISSGAITASSDITVSEAGNANILSNSVGDYFPSISISRTSGSSKTNYEYEFQIGSSGFLNFKDKTNGYYPLVFKNNGDVTLANDTASANPVLTLDQSASSATFSGTITATGGNSTNWNTAYTVANAALPKAGGTMTGILTINATDDNQILLTSPSSWTGIGFNDSAAGGTEYIWYNGTNGTFAIGGGGSNVANKKLHVDGGMTIGSSYDATAVTANSLNVQGTVTATGGNSTNWNTAYGWGNHASQSYATQSYVGTQISNLVDSSPSALNTLNELAAALGDDANFSTTVTNSIATKMPKAGGTFTGGTTYNLGGDAITISSGAPQMRFNDTTSGADDFWIHVNSNIFYILADRDDSGSWETPHPLALYSATNIGYVFGNRLFTEAYHPNADVLTTARTIAGTSFNGSANIDISYNNLTNKPTIPTNNNQLTNGAGYITSSHTGFDSRYITKGGSWGAANMPGSRWNGFSVNGGEVAFLRDNPNTSQMSVLADGAFYAGENNGFYSLYSGNSYNSKSGFYADTSGRLQFSGQTYAQFNTQYGNIKLGPMNASYAHIYTDRGSFYFNKTTLYADGNLMWTAGNDGSGSGLDADLLDGLQTASGPTANTIPTRTANGDIAAREIILSSALITATPTVLVSMYPGTNQLVRTTPAAVALGMSAWTSSNDGSGSGLDADLLDGVNSASFARVDAGSTYTNYGNIQRFYSNTNMATPSGSQASLECFSSGVGNDAFMTFHVGSDFACYFGLDGGTNKLSVGGWSMGANSYEIYHSGNKPSLAALGAQAAGSYLTTSGTAANSQLLDSLDSTKFTYYRGIVSGDWDTIFTTASNQLQTSGLYQVQNLASGHSNHPTGVYTYGGVFAWNLANHTFKLYSSHTGDLVFQSGWNNDEYSGWRRILNTSYYGAAWTSSNDGSGSGLDADLLDGYNSATAATANTVVLRDGNAHITGNYILGSYFNASSGNSENPTIGQIWTQSTGDNYLRKSTPAHFASQMGSQLVRTDGSNAAFVKVPSNYTGNLNSISNAGVYFTEATGSVSNNPFSSSGSFLQLGDAGGVDVRLQFYAKSSLDRIAFRNQWGNGNWGGWHEFWTTQNDGSGSGLDADTVDGLQASSFLRSDTPDTFSSHLSSANNVSIRFVAANATDANDGKIAAGLFGTGLNIVGAQTSAGTGRQVRIWGDVITDGSLKYWNAGNDGSGSGLDADTVDGIQSSQIVSGGSARKSVGVSAFAGVNEVSGFYFGQNITGAPTTDWVNYIHSAGNSWASSNNYSFQLTHAFHSDNLWVSRTTNGSQSTARKVWDSASDGSGSGLDADLLDGYNAAEGAVNNSIVKRDGDAMITAKKLHLNGGNYEGSIVFGAVDAWHTGIRQHDDGDAEMRIWARNSNGRIHIATGYDGEPASIGRPNDGFVVNANNVGIGDFSGDDPSQKLHVKGNILATGNVTAYSDEKLKDDIQVIENAVEKVKQLRGVTFTRNDLEDQKRHTGVIAQEVEKVLPEVVGYDEDRDTKTVAYGNMVGLLIEAIKEQQELLNKLTSRLDDIEKGE